MTWRRSVHSTRESTVGPEPTPTFLRGCLGGSYAEHSGPATGRLRYWPAGSMLPASASTAPGQDDNRRFGARVPLPTAFSTSPMGCDVVGSRQLYRLLGADRPEETRMSGAAERNDRYVAML